MPLPALRRPHSTDALAVEVQKRVLCGEPLERAAADAGIPADVVRDNPAAMRLIDITTPGERGALALTGRTARPALETREGRMAWLIGVVHGDIKTEGVFGQKREFPPNVRATCAKLLGLMGGDYLTRTEVSVTSTAVVQFRIPDNGRAPDIIEVECESTT